MTVWYAGRPAYQKVIYIDWLIPDVA